MRITGVKIMGRKTSSSSIIPEAEVELDGVLTLRGIHIHRSRFGYFLSFPGKGARSFVDLMQPAFATTLRQTVLEAFRLWRDPITVVRHEDKESVPYARSIA